MEKLRRVISHNNGKLNWAVVGEQGAIHIWCDPAFMGIGGFEVHSRLPMFDDHVPGQDCWLLNGTCHHDGSSLAYLERWRYRVADMLHTSSPFDADCGALWLDMLAVWCDRFGGPAQIDFKSPIERIPEAAVKATDALVAALTTFVEKYRDAADCTLGCGLVNGDFFAAERAIALAKGGDS
jgi:hypothetical protein